MTKLIEVRLRVGQVERSRRFYDLLGVPVGGADHQDAPGGEHHVHATWGSFSTTPDQFLMLTLDRATEPGGGTASVGFAHDDLDAPHARLVAEGVPVVHPPETRPWGRMATYRDPDGNLVSVSQRPR